MQYRQTRQMMKTVPRESYHNYLFLLIYFVQ